MCKSVPPTSVPVIEQTSVWFISNTFLYVFHLFVKSVPPKRIPLLKTLIFVVRGVTRSKIAIRAGIQQNFARGLVTRLPLDIVILNRLDADWSELKKLI